MSSIIPKPFNRQNMLYYYFRNVLFIICIMEDNTIFDFGKIEYESIVNFIFVTYLP